MNQTPTPSIVLQCDNRAAILVATNMDFNEKRRHSRLRHKVVKERLENEVISLDFLKSEKNLADPVRKGLCGKMIFDTSRGMVLRLIEKF